MALKQINFFNFSLPIDKDKSSKYFKLNTDIINATKDDFKVLLLTNKRERVMNPTFGIGFDELMWNNDIKFLKNEIEIRIREQVKLYLQTVTITKINCLSKYDLPEEKQFQLDEGQVLIQIYFNIKNVTDEQILELTMEF